VCYKSQLKSSRLRVSGDLRSITSNEQSHYKMVFPFVLTVQYFENICYELIDDQMSKWNKRLEG
jgi:hypothetical protein